MLKKFVLVLGLAAWGTGAAANETAATKPPPEATQSLDQPDAPPVANSQAKAGLRLLYLEPVAPDLSQADREILAGLLFDALGGRDDFLLITGSDLRRRAPMEADRIDTCREELCLYEFAESVLASHVLFSEVKSRADGQIQLDVSMFYLADAEIRAQRSLVKDSVSSFSGFVRPTVQNALSEAMQEGTPKLLENPFFLGSVSVLSFGTMAGLGALGYALELESALARPEVHRTEKERALEQGPTAIWIGIASASVAVVGLVATGAAVLTHAGAAQE